MNLLIAAHPDDEWLGASRLIVGGQINIVAYVVRGAFGARRLAEAQELGRRWGFTVFDLRVPTTNTGWGTSPDRVYVPSPSDPHQDHQAALTWTLQTFPTADLWEYSIEKYAPYLQTIEGEELAFKRQVFASVFASQRDDLTDPKYFLFEGAAPLGVPSITVKSWAIGFHAWPDAPEEVAFLRSSHRHVFHVRLTLRDLYLSDRQFEFFLVQRWLDQTFKEIIKVPQSCEQYARRTAIAARAFYSVPATVSVWEDNENGAEVSL